MKNYWLDRKKEKCGCTERKAFDATRHAIIRKLLKKGLK
jgi:hypothetical protein